MRIAILTPAGHFHAPVVLAALPLNHTYRVWVTPLVGPRSGRIARRCGLDYFASMTLQLAAFQLRSRLERWTGAEPRRFLRTGETAARLDPRFGEALDINAPRVKEDLRAFAPDVLVSIFFNQIVDAEILRVPRHGAFNVHPSLLPDLRGSMPVFWALALGRAETGVTIHAMDESVDHGAIAAQERVAIRPGDTYFSLYRRVAETAARLLPPWLGRPDAFTAVRPQGPSKAPRRTVDAAGVRRFRRRGRRFGFCC